MKKSRDVYDHLAKVYLDSSRPGKSKKSHHDKSVLFRNIFKIGVAVIVFVIVILTISVFVQKPASKAQVSLILKVSPTRLNYDFSRVEKETVDFDLRDIDLADFKFLAFRARKTNYRDNLHLCVEFVSDYEERSNIYIKQIPTHWENYKLALGEFKEISNWSRMNQLLFILEQWNAQVKKGSVYIDNVLFLN